MTSGRILLIVLALVSAVLLGQLADPTGDPAARGQRFGEVHFPISCSAAAQQNFNRAVAMLHSFYPDANDAFAAIVEAEPSCAMAYWGLAISQRPNPLTPPFSHAALKHGYEAIEKARAASAATLREQAWIEALAAFFDSYDTVDQKTRTLKYEMMMARLHARFPDDVEAAIFYALALNEAVDLADRTFARQLKAAAILEELEPRYPNHPGIPHYIIHSYDYPGLAHLGLFAAMSCGRIASSAPHALHMPAHIFSMLGMWHDVIRTEFAADAAVKAYTLEKEPSAGTVQAANSSRYHSLDFLTNAYLQLGQDQRANEIVNIRNSIAEVFQATRVTAHTAFAAIPVRYAFERGAWAEAAQLATFSTPYPQAEAITWFGRALGAARSGDLKRALLGLDRLSVLKNKLVKAGEPYWAQQVQIQEEAAAAWVALRESRKDDAIKMMRQAADLEDRTEKHIAMENRLSPMRELYGELLLEAEEPSLAIQEFESSLRTAPNRYRSIAGAVVAADRLRDEVKMRTFSQMLVQLADDADTDRLELLRARKFLAKK
jgi:hypothetical protein